jgi:hypothetical protein
MGNPFTDGVYRFGGAMKTAMIPSIDRFIIRILSREGK